MKRILPLLTIALAFTAATASAADYYDVYVNPTITQTTTYVDPGDGNPNAVPIYHETVNYGEYEVIRTSYLYQNLGHDSFYKVHINGDNVSLYLADYIDNVGDDYDDNALTTKGINKIGYRYIASNDTTKIGTSVSNNLVVDADKTKDYEVGYDKQNSWTPTVIEVEEPGRYENQHTITRQQYYLGTFNAGDEIEIYMQANGYGEAWSNTTGYTGGYGDGVTDAADRLAGFQLGLGWDWNATRQAAPLASLDVGSGHRVFYGLYGEASEGPVGSPLPGGLPVVLVSGLFALGFWYFRRNKTIAV